MAITLVGTAERGHSGTLSFTLPSHQAGDVGVIFEIHKNQGTDPALPGWTVLLDENISTAADSSCRVSVQYRVFASDSETNPSKGSLGHVCGILHIYRGVDVDNPIDNSYSDDTFSITSTAANRIVGPPAITSVTDNCTFVVGVLGGANKDSIAPSFGFGSPGGSVNYLDREAIGTTATGDRLFAFTQDRISSLSAGAEDPGDWSLGMGVGGTEYTTDGVIYTVALREVQSTEWQLEGGSSAAATLTGAPIRTVNPGGSSSATASAAGSPTRGMPMVGSTSASASTAGAAIRIIGLQGSVTGAATSEGSILLYSSVAGGTSATAALAGEVIKAINLSGDTGATAALAGEMLSVIGMGGSISCTATVAGGITFHVKSKGIIKEYTLSTATTPIYQTDESSSSPSFTQKDSETPTYVVTEYPADPTYN